MKRYFIHSNGTSYNVGTELFTEPQADTREIYLPKYAVKSLDSTIITAVPMEIPSLEFKARVPDTRHGYLDIFTDTNGDILRKSLDGNTIDFQGNWKAGDVTNYGKVKAVGDKVVAVEMKGQVKTIHKSLLRRVHVPLPDTQQAHKLLFKSQMGLFDSETATRKLTLKPIKRKSSIKNESKVLAVDFDGVIHKYSKGYGDGTIYDRPVSGAFEHLHKLMDAGYEIIIYTTRTEKEEIRKWFKKWKWTGEVPEITNKKPLAIAYIDDRAISFENWQDTEKEIAKIKKSQAAKPVLLMKAQAALAQPAMVNTGGMGNSTNQWNKRGGQKTNHKYIERRPDPKHAGKYIYLYELPNGKRQWKDADGKEVSETDKRHEGIAARTGWQTFHYPHYHESTREFHERVKSENKGKDPELGRSTRMGFFKHKPTEELLSDAQEGDTVKVDGELAEVVSKGDNIIAVKSEGGKLRVVHKKKIEVVDKPKELPEEGGEITHKGKTWKLYKKGEVNSILEDESGFVTMVSNADLLKRDMGEKNLREWKEQETAQPPPTHDRAELKKKYLSFQEKEVYKNWREQMESQGWKMSENGEIAKKKVQWGGKERTVSQYIEENPDTEAGYNIYGAIDDRPLNVSYRDKSYAVIDIDPESNLLMLQDSSDVGKRLAVDFDDLDDFKGTLSMNERGEIEIKKGKYGVGTLELSKELTQKDLLEEGTIKLVNDSVYKRVKDLGSGVGFRDIYLGKMNVGLVGYSDGSKIGIIDKWKQGIIADLTYIATPMEPMNAHMAEQLQNLGKKQEETAKKRQDINIVKARIEQHQAPIQQSRVTPLQPKLEAENYQGVFDEHLHSGGDKKIKERIANSYGTGEWKANVKTLAEKFRAHDLRKADEARAFNAMIKGGDEVQIPEPPPAEDYIDVAESMLRAVRQEYFKQRRGEKMEAERRGDVTTAHDWDDIAEIPQHAKAVTETADKIRDSKGDVYSVHYAIVPMQSVTASHDIEGNINPEHPSELQARKRTSESSKMQMKRISKNIDTNLVETSPNATEGAPIVYSHGGKTYIAQGNGRGAGIKGTEGEHREKYFRLMTEQAKKLGMSTENITPDDMLVRVLSPKHTYEDARRLAAYGQESNALPSTDVEKARAYQNAQRESFASGINLKGIEGKPITRENVSTFIENNRTLFNKIVDESGYNRSDIEGRADVQASVVNMALLSQLNSKFIDYVSSQDDQTHEMISSLAPILIENQRAIADGQLPKTADLQAIVHNTMKFYDSLDSVTREQMNIRGTNSAFLEENADKASAESLIHKIRQEDLMSAGTGTEQNKYRDPVNIITAMAYHQAVKDADKNRRGKAIQTFVKKMKLFSQAMNQLNQQQGDIFGEQKTEEQKKKEFNTNLARIAERTLIEGKPFGVRDEELSMEDAELAREGTRLDVLKKMNKMLEQYGIGKEENKVSKSIRQFIRRYAPTQHQSDIQEIRFFYKSQLSLFGAEAKPAEVKTATAWNRKGGQKPQHKYIRREEKGGDYIYYYQDDAGNEYAADAEGKRIEAHEPEQQPTQPQDEETQLKIKVKSRLDLKQRGRTFKDVGERVGGSRKEMAAIKLVRLGDLKSMDNATAYQAVVKDRVVPPLDIEERRKAGDSSGIIYLKKRLRESLNVRPANNPEARKKYVQIVQKIFEMIDAAQSYDNIFDIGCATFKFWHSFRGDKFVMRGDEDYDLSQCFSKEWLNLLTKRSEAARTVWATAETFDQYTEEQARADYQQYYIEGRRKSKAENLTRLDKRTPEQWENYLAGDPLTRMRLQEMTGKRGTNLQHFKKKNPDQYAKLLDEYKRGEYHAIELRFREKTFEEWIKDQPPTKQIREENWDWLNNEKKEVQRKKAEIKIHCNPFLTHIKRRNGIKISDEDVRAENIVEKYGYATVQFGHYVKDREAQVHVRRYLESLQDMADVLGIDIEKLNRQAGISIAFGARGGGFSTAIATYEPMRKIINLTKTKGDGSVSHEVHHFFDHFFGGGMEGTRKDKVYLSQMAVDWLSAQRYSDGKRYIKDGRERREIKKPDNVDQRVFDAMIDVMQAITKGDYTATHRFTYKKEEGKAEYEYPIIKSIYEKEGLDGAVKYIQQYNHDKPKENFKYYEYLSKLEGKEIEIKFPTQHTKYFYSAGDEFDSDYWSRPQELFARAAESYIQDKLYERGMENNYLVAGNSRTYGENKYERTMFPHMAEFVYPQREERARINDAMDKLWDAVKLAYGVGKTHAGERETKIENLEKSIKERFIQGINFFGSVFKSQMGLFETETATGTTRNGLTLKPSKTNPRMRRWQKIEDDTYGNKVLFGDEGEEVKTTLQGKRKGLHVNLVEVQLKKHGYITLKDIKINNPEDVADVMSELSKSEREKIVVLVLDKDNQLMAVDYVALGSVNASITGKAEIFRAAKLLKGKKIVMVHNHPSFNPKESDPDMDITRQMYEASIDYGIELLDYVIIAGDKYTSLEPRTGLARISNATIPQAKAGTKKVLFAGYQQKKVTGHQEKYTQIFCAEDVAKQARELLDGKEGVFIFALDMQNKIVGVHQIGNSKTINERDIIPSVADGIIKNNAVSAIIVSNGIEDSEEENVLREQLIEYAKRVKLTMNVGILDYVRIKPNSQLSYAELGLWTSLKAVGKFLIKALSKDGTIKPPDATNTSGGNNWNRKGGTKPNHKYLAKEPSKKDPNKFIYRYKITQPRPIGQPDAAKREIESHSVKQQINSRLEIGQPLQFGNVKGTVTEVGDNIFALTDENGNVHTFPKTALTPEQHHQHQSKAAEIVDKFYAYPTLKEAWEHADEIDDNDVMELASKETIDKYFKNGKWEQSRERLHKDYVDSKLRNVQMNVPDGERECVILAGGAGSGKTTASRQLFDYIKPDETHVWCDPDEAKLVIPEYKALTAKWNPKAAAVAHEEGSAMNKELMNKAIENKSNIVIDQVMADPDKAMKLIDRMKGLGYKIRIALVDSPTELSAKRAKDRYLRTRRIPTDEQIIENNHRAAQTFFKLLDKYGNDESVKDFYAMHNYSATGDPPVLAFHHDRDGDHIVNDEHFKYIKAKEKNDDTRQQSDIGKSEKDTGYGQGRVSKSHSAERSRAGGERQRARQRNQFKTFLKGLTPTKYFGLIPRFIKGLQMGLFSMDDVPSGGRTTKGQQKPNHKYIRRELHGGKYYYIYEEPQGKRYARTEEGEQAPDITPHSDINHDRAIRTLSPQQRWEHAVKELEADLKHGDESGEYQNADSRQALQRKIKEAKAQKDKQAEKELWSNVPDEIEELLNEQYPKAKLIEIENQGEGKYKIKLEQYKYMVYSTHESNEGDSDLMGEFDNEQEAKMFLRNQTAPEEWYRGNKMAKHYGYIDKDKHEINLDISDNDIDKEKDEVVDRDVIETKSFGALEDSAIELREQVSDYLSDKYNLSGKYDTLKVYENGNDEEIASDSVRIADHGENIINHDRYGREDYYISIVITNRDDTRDRFNGQNAFDRRTNERELLFDGDTTIEEAKEKIDDEIERMLNYIAITKGKEENTLYARGIDIRKSRRIAIFGKNMKIKKRVL